MQWKIGDVLIPGPLVLAPMAGVTDHPFRLLCKEQGADLVYTEMVSAKGILYQNKNTKQLLHYHFVERPIAVQLFGSDPSIMREAAKQMAQEQFDIIDINMGCPVPKVVNQKEGSALMANPKLVGQIIRAVADAVKQPVTVKFRKGFGGTENVVELAKIAQENGAKAIAIHGRTREEYYTGKADWTCIEQAKKAVKIPVIGNGDVATPEDAKRLYQQTGCEGIMIGRAARGNPWIFHQIKTELLTGEKERMPEKQTLFSTLERHIALQIAEKGEQVAIREMRKWIAWYTTGYPNAAKLRQRVYQVEQKAELDALLREFFQYNSSGKEA